MPEARSPSPRGGGELKSESAAGLTLDSAADLTLESPAELISYWPADLRRLPHPGCRLVGRRYRADLNARQATVSCGPGRPRLISVGAGWAGRLTDETARTASPPQAQLGTLPASTDSDSTELTSVRCRRTDVFIEFVSFRHKGLRTFVERDDARGLKAGQVKRLSCEQLGQHCHRAGCSCRSGQSRSSPRLAAS